MTLWVPKGLATEHTACLLDSGWLYPTASASLGRYPMVGTTPKFWGLDCNCTAPTNSLSCFSWYSDLATWCQTSTSLHNPFSPGASTSTEAHGEQSPGLVSHGAKLQLLPMTPPCISTTVWSHRRKLS